MMLNILLDTGVFDGPPRGKGFYRNRQIKNGTRPKMRTIDAIPQAWENIAKKASNNDNYTTSRHPFNIITDASVSTLLEE